MQEQMLRNIFGYIKHQISLIKTILSCRNKWSIPFLVTSSTKFLLIEIIFSCRNKYQYSLTFLEKWQLVIIKSCFPCRNKCWCPIPIFINTSSTRCVSTYQNHFSHAGRKANIPYHFFWINLVLGIYLFKPWLPCRNKCQCQHSIIFWKIYQHEQETST